ncbi:DinB family protein [Alkalihalophilus marmarensis]|uniref:DinB family protein n=1 Tax=Alkalihalophilus marmarensis TaxID=521377 RepID=UPI00203D9D0E|nr:DinB family protein [Alkalihalophilus marmarensis]MCM3490152.1 DinB family protein [Alkalihalophilus marmarensis]
MDYCLQASTYHSKRIGELIWMLEHTREVTLSEIAHLSMEELDLVADKTMNSIAILLAHIASIEFVHQVISFEKRDLTNEEYEEWGPLLEINKLAKETIRNKPVEYYAEKLRQIRERTLVHLKEKDDQWLFEESKWDNGVSYNNYYLWFHVMEDEISHRGQIRLIKRMFELG